LAQDLSVFARTAGVVVALVAVNSVATVAADAKPVIVVLTTFLLPTARMELETDISGSTREGRVRLYWALGFLFIS
jgi:hypothetical protein